MPKINTNAVVRTSGAFKDPKTKSDLVDKLLSRDFSGDIADLAVNKDLKLSRARPNVLTLTFGASGQTFELVVRKPRGPRTGESLSVKGGEKRGGRQQTVSRRKGGRVQHDQENTGTGGRATH